MPSTTPLSIVFFGTAVFAVPSLRALKKDPRFNVVAVVTQPDRPAGRKGEVRRSPVSLAADEDGIPVLPLESLKFVESETVLARLSADFFVVAAYGMIIPQKILDIPRLGCVNLHGSLLPKYRGASPIQEAIKNGDTETGVTLMKMDAQMDHGGLYAVVRSPVAPYDTHASLELKLGEAAAPLLIENLPLIANGSLRAVEQDHTAATFTQLIRKDDGRIDWNRKGAREIEQMLRAYTPWPGVFFTVKNDHEELRVKILVCEIAVLDVTRSPGLLFVHNGKLTAQTRDGALYLQTVQPEGKNAMDGMAFANGYKRFLSE